MNLRKKRNIIIGLATILFLSGGGVYLFFKEAGDEGCLKENETASYEIQREEGTRKGKISIFIENKNTNEKKKVFVTDTPSFNHYHPVELGKCHAYVIRAADYDYEKNELRLGSVEALWKFSYDGIGQSLFSFYERYRNGAYKVKYSLDFRVDPVEKYVALYRGYKIPEHAVVLKNLKTTKDDFILPFADLIKNYPDFSVGQIDFDGWTMDGKYYWGEISETAYRLAFFRIEAGTWKWEVFPAPEGTMGGDKLNVENGWVTYDDGAPWTGDADFAKMYEEQWKEEGKKVHFYLYNLFTKEQILLATVDDPNWSFKKQWISDTELEYYLPGDKREVYEVK